MNTGDVLLWVALALGTFTFIAKVMHVRTESTRWRWVHEKTAFATAMLLAAVFLLLCFLFLAVDVSVLYVWTYTGTWIDWPYRLAGAWTGREGSLLLWTAFMAGTVAFMAKRDRRWAEMHFDEQRARDWTDLVLAAILVAFLVAVARQGTFTSTDAFLLAGRPSGNGINPTLINPYILIHPPMMFLAYALTIVPAASGIAHMITGTGRWSVVAGKVSRVDWVLYTFAMGLGGLWAYYTLGFGGYWAWDPVEVANLLPWLGLTLYLHAQMMHDRKGWFAGVGPMLGVLPFLLTVFSTVSTRSGLWVSVHAFTDPTNTFNPDAAARLLGILDVDASLLPYFGVIVGLLLVSLALWCRRLALDHGFMQTPSRIIAGLLALAGGMAWVTPALFLSLVFEAGAMVGDPGLGALGLLAGAILLAASPALLANDEGEPERNRKKGWKRFVEVPVLAAVSVLLLSILLIVSLMWHFAAVNGWSEAFWDARIPWMLTPVVLALVVLMLRHRGKQRALVAAAVLLVAGVIGFFVGGLGIYAVVMSAGFLLASMEKMKSVACAGERVLRWRAFLLWMAAVVNLTFWVDPPSSLLFGRMEPQWPIHLLMIPLSVAGLVGAHLVGMGRPLRWPFFLNFALGGYFVAPILVLMAAVSRRASGISTKPFVLLRARPIGVYGVHLALAILMLGYATSTYYEVQETVELTGPETTFTLAGHEYATTLTAASRGGPVDVFTLYAVEGNQSSASGAAATLQWEPQMGSHRSLPGVLRLWDHDLYVSLDAVCIQPLDADGNCPPGGWVNANEATGRAWPATLSAARITAWSLPGVNLVWAGFALLVVYGIPVAMISEPRRMHRTQPSRPTKAQE